jgi:hypothetical protein
MTETDNHSPIKMIGAMGGMRYAKKAFTNFNKRQWTDHAPTTDRTSHIAQRIYHLRARPGIAASSRYERDSSQ